MTGRPSDYSQEIADEICERLINGQSLNSICKRDDMPGATTVYRWIDEKPAFRDKYARARSDQADTLADEILDIADDGDEDVQRSKLRVDARKWVASKLKPKKYGDRIAHAGDPEAPLQHNHSIDASKISTNALRELMAAKDAGDE